MRMQSARNSAYSPADTAVTIDSITRGLPVFPLPPLPEDHN